MTEEEITIAEAIGSCLHKCEVCGMLNSKTGIENCPWCTWKKEGYINIIASYDSKRGLIVTGEKDGKQTRLQ